MAEPYLFVSYSHDSEAHKGWVRHLCDRLVANGVHVILDQWDLVPGADIVAFMDRGIADADRVLMICSKEYVDKAEAGVGGVGYERLVVSQEIYQKIDTTKFIPLIRNNDSPKKVPAFLGARLYIDFTDDGTFDAKFDEVVRAVHNVPAYSGHHRHWPTFWMMPGAPPVNESESGTPSDSDWVVRQRIAANSGLNKLGRSGAMELGLSLTGNDQWPQRALYTPYAKRKYDIWLAYRHRRGEPRRMAPKATE